MKQDIFNDPGVVLIKVSCKEIRDFLRKSGISREELDKVVQKAIQEVENER